jgi:hypothetical protein
MSRARVAILIVVAVLWAAFLVFLQTRETGDPLLALITPGKSGPAWPLVREDFPESIDAVPDGPGHDGQMFYAIARHPLPLAAAVPYLDRPCYRLQRPLMPWLAHLLHPSGGGRALIRALVGVNVAGLLVGALATAGLLTRLGGRPELAAAFPMLGGALATLRLGTADGVATACVVAALYAFVARRPTSAIGCAVLAVLAKESMLGVLAGALLWSRSRDGALLFVVPAAVAAGWRLWVRHAVGCSIETNFELAAPFTGLLDSARVWASGQQLMAAVWVAPTILLALLALRRRGLRHPCGWPILLQLASICVLSIHVLGLDFNGPRATLPLAVLTLVALATPRPDDSGSH